MRLTGIIDAHEFRNRIIEARERLRSQGRGVAGEGKSDSQAEVLERIEKRLEEMVGLMRARM